MSFNYLIPPCSSAQSIIDNSGVTRYSIVGCPAVLLNNNKTMCSNGDLFVPTTGHQISDLTNRYNTINFNVGQIVYIEDIFKSLQSIFDDNTIHKFLDWNNNLIDDLKIQE